MVLDGFFCGDIHGLRQFVVSLCINFLSQRFQNLQALTRWIPIAIWFWVFHCHTHLWGIGFWSCYKCFLWVYNQSSGARKSKYFGSGDWHVMPTLIARHRKIRNANPLRIRPDIRSPRTSWPSMISAWTSAAPLATRATWPKWSHKMHWRTQGTRQNEKSKSYCMLSTWSLQDAYTWFDMVWHHDPNSFGRLVCLSNV